MSSSTDLPVLVIFCKRPLPGQGKQRIAATLGKDVAYEIASALLQCALEDARAWLGTLFCLRRVKLIGNGPQACLSGTVWWCRNVMAILDRS